MMDVTLVTEVPAMLPRCPALLAILLWVGVARAGEPVKASPEQVKAAVAKALPLLLKGSKGHVEQKLCFACHNQASPMLALTTARDRGFDIPADHFKEQVEHIARFLRGSQENYRKGKGQGGQLDTAGYALFTLELGGWKADDTTAAVAEYALLFNKDLDHWRSGSNRPPSEASAFTVSYFAIRGLQKWGTTDQKERIAKRIDDARAWLLKTPGKDTEDRVFRLWALQAAGAEASDVEAAAKTLAKTQCKDGGWAQLDMMDSDAYATGCALTVLHLAGGMKTADDAYQRGLAYLMKTQLDDGSWKVVSRSKPFQPYYESGFPHEKNQFISMAATGWAMTALALACPAPK
jgi:hypothetical protein